MDIRVGRIFLKVIIIITLIITIITTIVVIIRITIITIINTKTQAFCCDWTPPENFTYGKPKFGDF